jgi:hypothetical protein
LCNALAVFISKHTHKKVIVVADAAMLNEQRLAELREKHILYIVGARLANVNLSLVKQIQGTLKGVYGAIARIQSKHGEMICDFSSNRFKK